MAHKILGISAFYHDSAACLIEDGVIVAAAQEERFSRRKHDQRFPADALKFCLEYGKTEPDALDAVVFYDKPLLKFERLLETAYLFAPKGFPAFKAAMPSWIKEKVFLKKLLAEELGKLSPSKNIPPLLFTPHHLSHAASAFYPSPFEEAAVLTVDGVGEWATASIAHGKGAALTPLRELSFPHSVGLLYSAFTYYLGFRVNSGEYKVMGLAPYGDAADPRASEYVRLIKTELADIKEDGSICLNQKYFDYACGLRMTNNALWEKLFGFPAREPEAELKPEHCHMALAIQTVTDEIMLKLAATAQKLTDSRNLCLAGGVALNCVSNSKILRSGLFDNVWAQPAAGDAGGALGAALAAHHIYFAQPRPAPRRDAMRGALLGPEYSDSEIIATANRHAAPFTHIPDENKLFDFTADRLAEGKVAGWFQGRMEWGPRALGNRSILGDARNPDMQKRLNLKIKRREGFRPFAPSVRLEDMGEYFDFDRPSPYMLFVADITRRRRNALPPDYSRLGLKEKLYCLRSDIPAVTHLDFSARLQTVDRSDNLRYWKLLSAFKEKTGFGLLVNTSFNVRGEPIVRTPEDAYRCFMSTDMDILVMGNFVFEKARQPAWRPQDGADERRPWTDRTKSPQP